MHCSNFFKPFFVEPVISLNVTVILVLTTMYYSISNNLPTAAYIKMIDIWLMFNLFKPFLDIIIQTYMETLRVEEDREINHHGKPEELMVEEFTYEEGTVTRQCQIEVQDLCGPSTKFLMP